MKRLSPTVMVLFLLLFALVGCAGEPVKPCPPTLPSFPPQKVMESGDFSGFLAENERILNASKEDDGLRAVALLNLGFLHSYSKSPYRDPTKALKYYNELIAAYPQSPWAFQAKAWVDLIEKSAAAEKSLARLKGQMKSKMKSKIKSKDTAIIELEEQIKRARESTDTTINELEEQIKRAREIDLKIDQKERELLQ